MAIGDQSDHFARIKSLIPRWFCDETPVLDAVLRGFAAANAFVYRLLMYAAMQTRLRTASDGWLDMIAGDFFGPSLTRRAGQTDASFRNRIVINLFRERATRAGIVRVITELTGRAPIIFEPQRPLDTGSYGGPMCGYGAAGGYGSLRLPFQAFVTVFRPKSAGIPMVAGYGVATGGYDMPSQAEIASLKFVQGAVTDEDIYAALDSVKPVGTTLWTRITN